MGTKYLFYLYDVAFCCIIVIFNVSCDGETCSDVGVPEAVCEAFSGSSFSCPYSGWDIRNLFSQYNEVTDVLQIGIDCFGICGDADGDGDPGASSLALASLGGLDYPDLSRTE